MQRFFQLALDFFAAPQPTPLVSQPASPRQLAVDGELEARPAEPLSAVLQNDSWHHPRANRLVRLGHCDVGYEFKRGKRRTIGLSVGPDGLTVSAPRWTPEGEVDALLRHKTAWVLEKLRHARERAHALDQARIVWAHGGELSFLGKTVRLHVDPAHGFQPAGADLSAPAADGVAVLRLGLAGNASPAQIRDATQAWLMRQAKRVFAERLAHFEPQLGVRHKSLRLSSAATRWGSASPDGTIRLNWRLIHLSLEVVDYVVVHELSHLRHMDHSPQFWDVVASVMPDHAQRRQALKKAAVPLGK